VVEANEISSFVKKKANEQGIWIAMDAKSRLVLAFDVGDRSRRSAKRLWAKMPVGAIKLLICHDNLTRATA
jgi:insertion element IS1 protein InsB